jgi:hypothetical protein
MPSIKTNIIFVDTCALPHAEPSTECMHSSMHCSARVKLTGLESCSIQGRAQAPYAAIQTLCYIRL